jgi:hypothetical protein
MILMMISLSAQDALSDEKREEKLAQDDYINSLTADELFDMYSTGIMELSKYKQFNENYKDITDTELLLIKLCSNKFLKQTFTEQEVRNIFLDPKVVDNEYYSQKIGQVATDTLECVENGFN